MKRSSLLCLVFLACGTANNTSTKSTTKIENDTDANKAMQEVAASVAASVTRSPARDATFSGACTDGGSATGTSTGSSLETGFKVSLTLTDCKRGDKQAAGTLTAEVKMTAAGTVQTYDAKLDASLVYSGPLYAGTFKLTGVTVHMVRDASKQGEAPQVTVTGTFTIDSGTYNLDFPGMLPSLLKLVQ